MNNARGILSKEPLSIRFRPRTLSEFIGQRHVLGEGKLLHRIIMSENFPPLIFYGPPGSGKTTLGLIIARKLKAQLAYINAAFSNVSEVKKILDSARRRVSNGEGKTVVFIDEIHRFNKLQQDVLLPDTEQGTIVFIGATIYNPRRYLINSLVSRSVVVSFKALDEAETVMLLKRALADKTRGLGNQNVKITNKALQYLALHSGGDARKALSSLEIGVITTPPGEQEAITIDLDVAQDIIQKNVYYDRQGEYHYDTISAFIKSVRGSDPDSALYWLAKMIAGGEDARFIARRLIILASEDIGNANPLAFLVATQCFSAVEAVGEPESQLILAHATLYLSCSPKSNACYAALSAALHDVQEEKTREVPGHLKTHAQSYQYSHHGRSTPETGAYVRQEYGAKRRYYFPKAVGEEQKIKDFLRLLKDMPPVAP